MSEMVERVARGMYDASRNRILARINAGEVSASMSGIEFYPPWDEAHEVYKNNYRRSARDALEAMREVENDVLATGYEAMFEDKWDGSQAPMMGAGWEAMIDKAIT